MKDNLKQLIIKYLESEGESSKSRIEDYLKDLKGTTGDCCSRRLRELVSAGTVEKFKKEFQDKTYFAYRISKEDMPGFEGTYKALESLTLTQKELI